MDAVHESEQGPAAPSEDPREALARESAWVRRLARGLLGDEAAAEDLSQDVLTEALARRPALAGARLRAWLRTVARRLASRRLARERARRLAEERASRPERAARDARERLRLHARLVEAVDALEEPYRTALVLRYLEDLPPRAIAARLDIAPTAARKRVSRGLALLRARLERELEPGDAGLAAFLLPLAFPRPRPALGVPPSLSLTSLGIAVSTKLLVAGAGLVLAVVLLLFLRPGSSATTSAGEVGETAGALAQSGRPVPSSGEVDARPAAPADTRAVVPDAPASRTARVRVVDDGGRPVSTARAAWIDAADGVHPLELDASGTAPRPEGNLARTVVASAPGLAPGMARVGAGGADVVVTLPAAVALTGRVVEDGGRPGRPLWLWFLSDEAALGLGIRNTSARQDLDDLGLLPYVRLVWTDADGSFRLDDLPPGWSAGMNLPSTHRFEPGGATAGWSGTSRRVRASDSPLVLRTLRLPTVRGRMVWADDGSPIPGPVWVSPRDRKTINAPLSYTHADAEGRFEVGIEVSEEALLAPPGERARGIQARSLRIGVDDPLGRALPFERAVDLEGATFPLDLGDVRVPRAQRVRVHVVGPDGDDLEGVVVATSLHHTRTDAEGLAELATTGDEEVQALAPGFHLAAAQVPDAPPDAPLEIRLEPAPSLVLQVPPGSFTGRARGRLELAWDRTPFEGGPAGTESDPTPYPRVTTAALAGTWVGTGGRFSRKEPGLPGSQPFDLPASGRLAVPGLRAGSSFRIRLLDGTGAVVEERAVVLPEEPGEHVESFSTDGEDGKRATTIRLRIVTADGTPIAGAYVSFLRGGKSFGFGRADSDGGYVLCVQDTAELRARIQAHGFLERRVDVVPPTDASGAEPEPVEIVLAGARDLDVRLIDARGRALRFEEAKGKTESGWERSSATGTPGHLLLVGAPREAITLTVQVGTATWTRTLSADETRVDWTLPVHGALAARAAEPPALRGEDGTLRLRVTPLAVEAGTADAGTLVPGSGPAERTLWYGQDAVGPLELGLDLLPGTYRAELELEERPEEGGDPTVTPIATETVAVVAGKTTRIER